MTISFNTGAAGRRVAYNMPQRSPMPGSRTARAYPRWPDICSVLDALREQRRRAVRIVDADCACGSLLIAVVQHARTLGFTAIEGHGIDGSPAMIGRARAAAARCHDPAIGLSFEVADMLDALAGEADVPADIVLWHGDRDGEDRSFTRASLAAAGNVVIMDGNGLDGKAVAA